MRKILSIIIPTYNMELYLRRCLNSLIIGRNFDLLDVIIVNDGSKDKSLEIAREYVSKYPSVYRVIDKSNGNYGSCVNVGLKVALGKYVKILDADDYFDKESLEKVLEFLSDNDVDLLVTDYRIVDNYNIETKRIEYVNHFKYDEINYFSSISDIKRFARLISMHSVIYKIKNLIDINYCQTEGVSYTDVEWIFSPMLTVDNIGYLHVCLYNYWVGREGQTVDRKVMLRNISHTMKGAYKMIDEYSKWTDVLSIKDQYLKERLSVRLSYIYRNYFLEMNSLDYNDLIRLDSYIKEKSVVLYRLTSNYVINRMFTYNYIYHWRDSKYENKVVNFVIKNLLLLDYMLRKIRCLK